MLFIVVDTIHKTVSISSKSHDDAYEANLELLHEPYDYLKSENTGLRYFAAYGKLIQVEDCADLMLYHSETLPFALRAGGESA